MFKRLLLATFALLVGGTIAASLTPAGLLLGLPTMAGGLALFIGSHADVGRRLRTPFANAER